MSIYIERWEIDVLAPEHLNIEEIEKVLEEKGTGFILNRQNGSI